MLCCIGLCYIYQNLEHYILAAIRFELGEKNKNCFYKTIDKRPCILGTLLV